YLERDSLPEQGTFQEVRSHRLPVALAFARRPIRVVICDEPYCIICRSGGCTRLADSISAVVGIQGDRCKRQPQVSARRYRGWTVTREAGEGLPRRALARHRHRCQSLVLSLVLVLVAVLVTGQSRGHPQRR